MNKQLIAKEILKLAKELVATSSRSEKKVFYDGTFNRSRQRSEVETNYDDQTNEIVWRSIDISYPPTVSSNGYKGSDTRRKEDIMKEIKAAIPEIEKFSKGLQSLYKWLEKN